MSGNQQQGPGGFNPGAYEFRPGQQPFVPRQQQQQQAYDPYAGYGQQQPYGGQHPPPQQAYRPGQQQSYVPPQYGGYGGQAAQQPYYPQQQQQPPQPQQQAYNPQAQQRTFVPRPVQGFAPPSFTPGGGSSTAAGSGSAAPSLSIGGGGSGGASKAAPAPSLSIGGGGASKAAPSLSIGGDAKPKAPISLGGGSSKASPAPSLSIGGGGGAKKEAPKKEETPAPAAPSVPAPAASAPAKSDADEIDEEFAPKSTTSAVPSAAPAATASPATQASALPATDATAKVIQGASGTSTPTPAKANATASSTNFSKVTAKNDAEAVYKEQAAAGADAMRDLYGDDGMQDPNIKGHLNIIFTGHVDAGKSTMGGQLLYLTGAVDKRTMQKYEQEAKAAGKDTWYLSWALDSGKEERAQGKTVEVGRAYFETEKRRYTILDAPGHKTFVPSMITGAAQADIAMLVLSARKGEFETGFDRDGQTREHAVLIKNNGISKLVILINKMDDPTVQWDQARFDEIRNKITPFLKSLGFNPKTDLTFIPVSAQMGHNMKEPLDKSIATWYTGPTLIDFMDNMEIMDRDVNAPFMFPVSEKYNEMGTMVMGKIESGRVKKGDTLLCMPNKTTVEVSGLYTEENDEMEAAFCGDNIRIRLRGISDEDVMPGFVLTSPSKPVKAVTTFKADLSILETKSIICGGYSCVLHAHTLAEEVTITALLHYFERKTRRKSKKPPQFAKTGMMVQALIETSAPICIERFEDYKMLGRFTLRDEGKTVAIGKVVKLIEKAEDMPDVAKLSVNA